MSRKHITETNTECKVELILFRIYLLIHYCHRQSQKFFILSQSKSAQENPYENQVRVRNLQLFQLLSSSLTHLHSLQCPQFFSNNSFLQIMRNFPVFEVLRHKIAIALGLTHVAARNIISDVNETRCFAAR